MARWPGPPPRRAAPCACPRRRCPPTGWPPPLGAARGSLWIKHDDLTGIAGGGNKVRKLEHLAAGSLAEGADTLVTGGGRQSNHVRLTAAVANRTGLAATVVLASDRPERPTGNVVLDEVLGPELVWAGDLAYYDLEDAITATAARPRRRGAPALRHPRGRRLGGGRPRYVGPPTRSTPRSPASRSWWPTARAAPRRPGRRVRGSRPRVIGVDVGTRPDLDDAVPAMAAETAALAGRPAPGGRRAGRPRPDRPGLRRPSDACREASTWPPATRSLLDPVCTGRGLPAWSPPCATAHRRAPAPPSSLHTGGLPALPPAPYADWVRTRP